MADGRTPERDKQSQPDKLESALRHLDGAESDLRTRVDELVKEGSTSNDDDPSRARSVAAREELEVLTEEVSDVADRLLAARRRLADVRPD